LKRCGSEREREREKRREKETAKKAGLKQVVGTTRKRRPVNTQVIKHIRIELINRHHRNRVLLMRSALTCAVEASHRRSCRRSQRCRSQTPA